jgi:hypothetical protein
MPWISYEEMTLKQKHEVRTHRKFRDWPPNRFPNCESTPTFIGHFQ